MQADPGGMSGTPFGNFTRAASDAVTRHSTIKIPPPEIPDHKLLYLIGRGAYGEVWLARNAIGTLRAVKVVHRPSFERAEHFEREFKGLLKFEPISRSHDGLVDILQIGRRDDAGYFFYVMELADDSGASPKPEIRNPKEIQGSRFKTSSETTQRSNLYSPRTLRSELQTGGPLPPGQCISIGLTLASALEHLHSNGLVHRDIKPSNTIFVNGAPKLADIGLVTAIDDAHSLVGTAGYIPPEGPGTPQADLYSFGKVLYEMAFGKERQEFPQLPPDLESHPDYSALLELNEIILRACESDPRCRYQSAQQMHHDLELLKRGVSIKRTRMIQGRLAAVRRMSLVTGVIVLMAVGGFVLHRVGTRNNAGSGGTVQLEMKGTKNRAAWNAYLTGRHYFDRLTADGIRQGAEYLKEAINLDPNFAEAHATLAELYGWGDLVLFSSAEEAMVHMEEEGLRALALDDRLGLAHKALGYVEANLRRDFAKAEKEMRRAIELSPDYAQAHAVYGWLLLQMGRSNEAKQELKQAQWLDPISARICFLGSHPFFYEGNFQAAGEQLRKAIDLDANCGVAFRGLAHLYEEQEEFQKAIEMFQKAALIGGENPESVERKAADLRNAYATGKARGYWQKRLEQTNLASSWSVELDDIAVIYLHLGNWDSVFEYLNKAEAAKSDYVFFIKADKRFDPLRSDPRFKTLLQKLRLEN